MDLIVLGPNLPAAAGEMIHVHRLGCVDVQRSRSYSRAAIDAAWTMEADSWPLVVSAIYPPDNFDYDPDSDAWLDYLGDIRFFPCTDGLRTT